MAPEPINAEGMRELALFAGAGGGILGGHLLGWRTVCAVEINDYARRVLMARQDDGCLRPFPIWDDICTFDGRPWRGLVDVISGGFPCQDISVAGKGAGITGARSGLWGHMARIIGEVGPQYVLVENSPALAGRGLGTVLGDLASLGYHARWGILGAHHAGAPHKRDRIWILAHACKDGWRDAGKPEARAADRQRAEGWSRRRVSQPAGFCCGWNDADGLKESSADTYHELADAASKRRGEAWGDCERPEEWASSGSEVLADSSINGWESRRQGDASEGEGRREPGGGRECEEMADASSLGSEAGVSGQDHRQEGDPKEPDNGSCGCGWWASDPADDPESGVGRVAHGVANRVDRLKAIGNGQVPAVVRLAWETLRS